jgi:hypothetical protein
MSGFLFHGNAGLPGIGQLAYTSVNSGGTWTRNWSVGQFVVEYSSGSKEGWPVQSVSTGLLQVYSAREEGIKFRTLPGPNLRVIGITAQALKASTPTGDLRYRIYLGDTSSPTLLATTNTKSQSGVNTSRSAKTLYFNTPQIVPANTTVRVVISETTNSDVSSLRYECEAMVLSSTDTGIIPPYADNPSLTASTDGGATFSDTSHRIPLIWMVLDGEQPFSYDSATGSRFDRGFN